MHAKDERWFGFNELDGKLPEALLDANLVARYFDGTLNNTPEAKELVLNNNNQSLGVTHLLFNLPNLNAEQAQSLLDYLQEQGCNDQLRVAEWAGFFN